MEQNWGIMYNSDALKVNSTLVQLDLSRNNATGYDGGKDIADALKSQIDQ